MSTQYNKYLEEHIGNVIKGYEILKDNLDVDFVSKHKINFDYLDLVIRKHDQSKYTEDEYFAYDEYFYGTKCKETKEKFDLAWLHHQNTNKHHWQYWLLKEDNGLLKPLDMDIYSIIEMVCDWWSFSLKQNKPLEILKFYNDHESTRVLSNNTKYTVLEILDTIKTIKISNYKI